MLSIGYKGTPPLVADLLTGRLSATIMPAVLTTSQVKSGALRPLAVLSTQRSKTFPEVPTLAEAGYPEAQLVSWFGVLLLAKTQRDVLKRVADKKRKRRSVCLR